MPASASRSEPGEMEKLRISLSAAERRCSALEDEIQRLLERGRQTSAFWEISEAIWTAATLEEICDKILARIESLLPCLGCWLSTVDRVEGTLQVRALRGIKWTGGADQSWLSIDRLRALPNTGLEVWTIDRDDSPPEIPWPAEAASTMAIASLRAQDGYVGALVLALGPRQGITVRRKSLLASLARQAAPVIRSADMLFACQESVVREERSRIGREIHDGVSQNLALLMLRMEIISRLAQTDPRRLKAELEKVQEVLESSVYELRKSVYSLRLPDLGRLGLAPALRRLARAFSEQTNVEMVLSLPPGLTLPLQAQSAVFNAVQERLDAVARESSATRVSLQLHPCTDQLVLHIRDDGSYPRRQPLDGQTSAATWQGRVRERVQPLGGSVQVVLDPPETTVEITIPLRDS